MAAKIQTASPVAKATIATFVLLSCGSRTKAQVLTPSQPPSFTSSSISDRTTAFRSSELTPLSGRLYVPSLIGKVSPVPATVQGVGQTVVANSIVVNAGTSNNVLEARCPLNPAGRVIVQDNQIVSPGNLIGTTAGGIVIDCRNAAPGGAVSVTGNQVGILGIINR